MAVEFRGFSIRDYAWKMRSVEVEKCWPFSGGDIKGDRVHSLLPPITVPTFRWWSHELAVLREHSRAAAAAAAAAEDSQLPARRAKVKSRQPKKRSIVEIFAEAPQIETVRHEDGGDIDGDDYNVRLSDLKRKSNKQLEALQQQKKIKNNKKKKHDDAVIAKKVAKYKEESQVTFCKKLDGAKCSWGSTEETSNVVSLSRKKAAPQCLSNLKKGKPSQSTKSVTKDPDQAFHVHSILKTKRKVNEVEIASGCNLKNPHNLTTSVQCEKRVRFSDHSDLLSQRKRKTAFKPSFCSLQKNARHPSSTVDQASENGKALPDTLDDDTHMRHKLLPVVAEGQLTHAYDKVNLSSFLRPHYLSFKEKIKNVSKKSLPPSELGIISNDCGVADNCVPATTHKLNLTRQMTDYGAEHIQDFAARDMEGKAQADPQLRSSTFALKETMNKRNPFLSQPSAEDTHCRKLQYWSSFHESLVEQKQKAVISKQTYTDDGFLGFPLSLQGEKVPAERLRFGGFDQLLFSGLATSSCRSLPTENKHLSRSMVNFPNLNKRGTETAMAKDSLDLFPLQNEKRPKYFPARLGVDESFAEKANANSDNSDGEIDQTIHSQSSDLSLRNHSFNVWKQNGVIQNQNRKKISDSRANQDHMLFYNTPATMRLMGKDVTVGTSSSEKQFSWAGEVRTNEGIIAQNSPICTSPFHLDSSLLGRHTSLLWPTRLGNSENTLTKTFDNKWDATLQSDSLKDPVAGLVTRASGGLTPDQSFHPAILKACNPLSSCPMFGSGGSFQGSGLSKPNGFMIDQQLHFPSNPQVTGPPLGYRSVDVNLNPLVPNAVKPFTGFPFPRVDASGQSLPSWSHDSFQYSIPWLLSAAQQDKATLALQLSPQVKGSAAGPDYLVNESMHQFHVVNSPHDRMKSCLYTGMSSDTATQLSPTFSGFKTSSYINFGKGNRIKAEGRMTSNVHGAQDAVHFNKSNKRQMAVEEYSMKNHKMPRLQTQDGLESMTELASNNVNFEKWDNEGVHCTRSKHLMDNARASPGVEFSRNGMWTGPVKLSAGSKHVLKPNQNTNQDCPGLMHSAIPLISFSDHDSFAGQGMKSSQIYRF